jgi:hypothetical protein
LKVVFRLLLRKKLFTIGTYLGFYLLVFLFLDDTKVLNSFVFVVFYVRNEGFEAGLKYWPSFEISTWDGFFEFGIFIAEMLYF